MYRYLILYIECFENIKYGNYIMYRNIFDVITMARQKDETKPTRNIVLKAETYEKLDQYKVKLIGKRKTSAVTYDDTINELLENMKK